MSELAEYLVKVMKGLRGRKVSLVSVLAAASTSIAVVLLFQLYGPATGSTAGSSAAPASPNPTASATAEAPELREVGGVDIMKHCEGLGFSAQHVGGQEVHCQSPVDMLAACRREHPATVRFSMKADDPYSGSCRDAAGRNLGGITDMLGHCRAETKAYWTDQVTTTDQPGNKWHCRIGIDVSAACAGQYNDRAMTARWVSGSWRCSGNSKVG